MIPAPFVPLITFVLVASLYYFGWDLYKKWIGIK